MKKVKIIDLLNSIATKENIPQLIKYNNYYWIFQNGYYFRDNNNNSLFDSYGIAFILNDEVEIVEILDIIEEINAQKS